MSYIVVLSPAKRLQLAPFKLDKGETDPYFKKEADAIIGDLRGLNVTELKKVMDIKDSMVGEVQNMLQHWGGKDQTCYPAAALYNGDAYLRLGARDWTTEQWKFASRHLFILSGVYGALRATDRIAPYRLMVGAAWKGKVAPDGLYPYWKQKMLDYATMHWKQEILLNLASQEYAEMLAYVDLPIINVDFKVNKQGKLATVSSFSKQARGAMARWIVEHQPKQLEIIKDVKILGFQFSPELSNKENWIFVKS